MNKVTLPLIKQVPLFLVYCRDTGLSENTQKNYERYLNKFIFWLGKKNKNYLYLNFGIIFQ